MKKGITILLFILCPLFISSGIAQQKPEDIKALAELYDRFTKAYKRLDVSILEDLYGEKAYYLQPVEQNPILQGREQIMKSFKAYFDWVRQQDSQLMISFCIQNREISGNKAYDVGYYKIIRTTKDGEKKPLIGKFVTVIEKQVDGHWRFIVDSYNGAPASAFTCDEK